MRFPPPRGRYKTNIDPVLRYYASFAGENKPDSQRQFVETETRLLVNSVDHSRDERPFSKVPPRLLGELIDLVRMLPPFDSAEFKLLHPVTIFIEHEPCTPIDIERGIAESPRFAKCFNELFEASTDLIRTNKRELHGLYGLINRVRNARGEEEERALGPVDSCAYWGGYKDIWDLREELTAKFWKHVVHRDVNEVEKKDYESWDDYFKRVNWDDDYSELTWKHIEFDEAQFADGFDGAVPLEMELSREVTFMMDRVGRFGLPQRLADFLMQEPIWLAFKRMIDLYEAFYLLHDVAYMVENDLTQVVLRHLPVSSMHDPQLVREDGMLRQRRSLFWDAIAEDDVRAAQIRTCRIANCRKIFWAKAKNQICCSQRCSNTYHVQNYRYKSADQKATYIARQIERERRRGQSQVEAVVAPKVEKIQAKQD